MALTSLPVVGTGQDLGPTKSDAKAATDTSRQLAASEWNAAAVALEEVCASVGLATSPAAGSIEAERLRNVSEIGADLTDSDRILVSDASDTIDHATGTVKGSLLSRISTYIQSAIPIAWGTWTPTLTAVLNVDATSGPSGIYVRVGDVVVAALIASVDPTASATFTQFRASLPILSAFAATTNLLGLANGPTWSVGRIQGDPTNDEADVILTSGSTSAQYLFGLFLYRVI